MELKALSNSELSQNLQNLQNLVREERRVTTEILHHLREVERRMLYATMGYPSLIAYCIEELKYSESAAHRRIQSMHLLKEIPEIEEKIQTGELTLTTVAQTASFFKQVKDQKNKSPSIEEKRKVLSSVENLSRRETERFLSQIEPDLRPKPREKQRVTSNGDTHISVVFDAELMKTFEEIQNLMGKQSSLKELIRSMAESELKRLQKQKGISRKGEKSLRPSATPPAESSNLKKLRPYVSRHIKGQVWARADYSCEYVNSETKKRCGEKFGLQLEHTHPVALGGSSDLENLSLLCPTHNRLNAVNSFGHLHMQKYVGSIRG